MKPLNLDHLLGRCFPAAGALSFSRWDLGGDPRTPTLQVIEPGLQRQEAMTDGNDHAYDYAL